MVASSLPQSRPVASAVFDWPLCHDAERLLREYLRRFLQVNAFAARLAERMRDETGTDFFEWVDHLALPFTEEQALRDAGFVTENVPSPAGMIALWHPRAMMPRVLLQEGAVPAAAAAEVAIRPEVLDDFLAIHHLAGAVEGSRGARFRPAMVAADNGGTLTAVERLAWRGFVAEEPTADFLRAIEAVRETWRTRRRDFSDDAQGIAQAFELIENILGRVDRDVACDLFFAAERKFWQARNRAAQIQYRRQEQLGLGWGNHDHHTFRCSRERFADLMVFLARLGFEKRERYYAGAEAGWGAQILEQPIAGIVVFADVDLMPEETAIDFSSQRLPRAPRLGTVGLWCGLHGDSFLQAGMHHLEARFDFALLRDQLAAAGVTTMRPFSDFDFLRQAFTEGERWPVRPACVARLREDGLISAEQAELFSRDGAIGSHLENLQRKGGFKGFNQKSVSVIISATDPRKVQAGH